MKKENKLLIFLLLLIVAFFLATCCTPQKRLNSLVKNHPELVKVDTLRITDTTFLNGSYADTVVSLLASRTDTIVLTHNNIITKVFTHRDSIFISQTENPDTIIKTIAIPHQFVQPVTKPSWWSWFNWERACIAFLLLLLLMLKLSKRIGK